MQPYGTLDCFKGRTEGFQRASGKPFGAPAGANPCPRWGLTRRLRREGWACRPYGALTLFFRWRKKSVQKKASGTATPGKRLLLPILAAGLAMSRAAELASLRMHRARSELAFFRRQNGRAFFPPLPIAALLPRSWRGADLPLAGWDASVQLGDFAGKRPAGFQIHAGLFSEP